MAITFEVYSKSLSEKISDVKLTILKTLWDAGESFPRDWVRSSRLLAITNQKYFDRRTRELRDELGCNIETQQINGEHCYRLVSQDLQKANPRLYLSNSQKDELFKRYNYQCPVCGLKEKPGVRGLQADHKVPLIRNGTHDPNNWQAMCNVCNVGKRRACAGCLDDCDQCPWAFPEKVGSVICITIPLSLAQRLSDLGLKNPKNLGEIVIASIEKYLKEKF